MAVAIGIWSLELTPGKVEAISPEADLRITNISFGETLKDASGRSVVKFTYQTPAGLEDEDEDEDDTISQVSKTTVLCSLKPGTFEQASTNVILQEEEVYTFEVAGKNVVYLTGNYLDQGANNPPFLDSGDESESDDEEDAYDLREVSSDVEMDPEDLDGLESDTSRFEEVVEEAPKSSKRPRESDGEGEETEKPSKAEKKKKKKQKAENGEAIEVVAEEKKEEKKAQKKEKEEGQAKKTKSSEKEIAGGVKVLDVKVGQGPQAKKGSTVKMRYIGKLQNGKVFDKNISGKPFTFHLGKGEVIKGWDEGIVGMQVGGERKLTIPPAMAYGNKAMGDIPKNSTLVFEVKLLEIK